MDAQNNQFKFHGQKGEYFGIWIVNILLTIVTLGIYAAWAHVRNKQYFYSNTELAGSRFEFLATPKQILVGYLVMAGAYLLIFIPFLGLFIFFALVIAFPLIIQRSLKFNAQMTRYRGVRFDFKSSTARAYAVFFGWPLLAYAVLALFTGLCFLIADATLGLPAQGSTPTPAFFVLGAVFYIVFICLAIFAGAFINQKITEFVHNGYLYGTERFNGQYPAKTFFTIAFKTMGVALLVLFGLMLVSSVLALLTFGAGVFSGGMSNPAVGSAMALGIPVFYLGFIAAFLIIQAYAQSRTRNFVFGQTFIGEAKQYRFASTVKTLPYATLLLTNLLMVVFTLGLLTPFARVRHAQFMADATQISGDLDALNTQQLELSKTNALGDGMSNLFDIDIQF
jgi:uncharacterized membrane protein YjgN (DUF898 family)